MNIEKQFDIIINNSIKENKTDPDLHLVEEMSELMCELFNFKRGKQSHVCSELADVYFQIRKFLKKHKMTEEDLMKTCIKKTHELFPHQLKEL